MKRQKVIFSGFILNHHTNLNNSRGGGAVPVKECESWR
ncbi:hypothetical protein CHCC20335_2780 [Bacillus paralicheniformis]|nr:hypothetical protein CHCC20335_2780 [Bacillus paralicheniformis]